MRYTPWILPFVLSAALLTATSYVVADNHEPLDDAALEKEYGIKAGSVKRDEEEASSSESAASDNQASSREEEQEENNGEGEAAREGEDDVELEPGPSEERSPEAGTGGTGSPEDAIHSSEEENSENADNDGTDDSE
nr:hypothetical protein [uncultured Halomonas sp.]